MRRVNNGHDELKMQKYIYFFKWLNSMKLMLNLPPEGHQEPSAVAGVGVRLWMLDVEPEQTCSNSSPTLQIFVSFSGHPLSTTTAFTIIREKLWKDFKVLRKHSDKMMFIRKKWLEARSGFSRLRLRHLTLLGSAGFCSCCFRPPEIRLSFVNSPRAQKRHLHYFHSSAKEMIVHGCVTSSVNKS